MFSRLGEKFYCNNDCATILRKLKRYIVLFLTALSLTIALGGSALLATEPNDNTTQRAIECLLEQSGERKITRIELYYMGLNVLTDIAITENSLRDNYWEFKVIIRNTNLSDVKKSLREFKFEKTELQSFDLRWGCVFYAENEEILRLFFTNTPVVVINGIGHKATPALIRSLMQFLPVEAYKEMNEFIEKHWEPAWQISSKQQTSIEDKKN